MTYGRNQHQTQLAGIGAVTQLSDVQSLCDSWSANVRSGRSVSIQERNAMVAFLAYARTMLAGKGEVMLPLERAPEGDPERDYSRSMLDVVWGEGVFEPRGTATSTEPSSGVYRPGGAIDATGLTSSPLTDQERRAWIEVAEGCGALLALDSSTRFVQAGTLPAGALPIIIPAAVYWIIGATSVAGVISYAGYASVTNGQRLQASNELARIRIVEDNTRAMRVDEMRQRLAAVTARWEEERRRGTSIAPSVIETSPLTPPRAPALPTPQEQSDFARIASELGTKALYGVGIFLGVSVAVGAAERYMARRAILGR